MFSKILIANRGEIAVRIIRACKEMGISTVAVFSEADRSALFVSLADESYCIGPALAGESYLNISAILAAAVASGAQAIHPGYGFLSENPKFSKLCAECGIEFIGPSAEVITKMGNKDEARKLMASAGVPIVPGTDILKNSQEAKKCAAKIGYPVILKARAGGGGRGIRIVASEDEIEKAFNLASAESASAFGDGGMYMEKYLNPVKHVEFQLLCDNFGHVVTLGERECSAQRKNQKMIEESPSPSVSEELRRKLIRYSTLAAKAANYRNAGTIEYLLDNDGKAYFMEMNTRLQVEHGVSELVTGIDIVKWQIRIAAGIELKFRQQDIKILGAAIECRINAENPELNFRPSAGKVELLHIPGGPWVRFDTGLYQGYDMPPFYDSMIGKAMVLAATREEAIRKMQAALCELVIEGIDHTAEFQKELLVQEEFKSGNYHTDFIAKFMERRKKTV